MPTKHFTRGVHALRRAGFVLSLAILWALAAGWAPAFAGDTQIVVQWPVAAGSPDAAKVSEQLTAASDDFYYVDGDDVTGKTANVFLFADDASVAESVKRIVALRKRGLLPEGVRIAIARYKDDQRMDWNYEPVFPADLKTFAVTP